MGQISANEWREVYDMPADGSIRSTSFGRGVHYAATKIQVESAFAEKDGQAYRRRNIRGYWNNAEPVSDLGRNTPLFEEDPFKSLGQKCSKCGADIPSVDQK